METIFSKIIERAIPAEILYETDAVIAFLDISPNNPGHTLVVPKTYSRNLFDISAESWSTLMETVRILAPRIRAAVGADAINIMMNNDDAAGQMVFHTHVHIIPRFKDDGYRHWQGHSCTETEMKQVAEKIRTECLVL